MQNLIIGLGGAGNNIVSFLKEKKVDNSIFLLIQTDENTYKDTIIENKILLDIKNNLNIEEVFNINSRDIQKYFNKIDKVFIVAGLGGLCGSKVLFHIGDICSKYNSINHAIVTKPFQYEGALRSKVANETIKKSKEKFSHFKIFENQSLFEKANKDTTFTQAFDILNESIYEYVRLM